VQWKERGRNAIATAFQADDEGSIPFTRSNVFNDLVHGWSVILTSRLLLILTNDPPSFAGGVRKKRTGRHYRGRTFDEMPHGIAMS
jgi:hypothetical protein